MRGRFFDGDRGELMGFNDNQVPIRMILLNIWDNASFNEDPALIANAINPDGSYEWVGNDFDAVDESRERFSFNFFRLGDLTNGEQPSANVQRRVAIVSGSTNELLYTLTPIGTGGNSVAAFFERDQQVIIDAVNSVQLVPEGPAVPNDLSISVNSLEFEDNNVVIEFTSAPGLSGFNVLGTANLGEGFVADSPIPAEIVEINPGFYVATIDAAEQDIQDDFFFCITF